MAKFIRYSKSAPETLYCTEVNSCLWKLKSAITRWYLSPIIQKPQELFSSVVTKKSSTVKKKKGKILGLRTILKWRSFLLKRSADVKPDVFFINLDNVFSDVNRSLISFLSVNQRCSILNKYVRLFSFSSYYCCTVFQGIFDVEFICWRRLWDGASTRWYFYGTSSHPGRYSSPHKVEELAESQ